MSTLDPAILAKVEMHPVEDLLLALLPSELPGIKVRSLIADDQDFPLVMPRRSGDWGEWEGDPRFLDACQVDFHVFAEGLDADTDGALLSEALRVILLDCRNKVVPGKGHLTKVVLTRSAQRVSDWATATGPVQYADLPTGVVRYQSTYRLEIKKPPRIYP